MAQTIRRGGKGVRRAAAARTTRKRVATARKQTGNIVGQAVRWLPFSDETLHRMMIFAIVGAVLGAIAIGAEIAGVPAMAENEIAVLAGHAGFKVKRVEVRGVNRMNELAIYEKVLGQVMSRLDLAALRTDLLTLPWVKDARVSRQLPDTLVVDVVEFWNHRTLLECDLTARNNVNSPTVVNLAMSKGPGVHCGALDTDRHDTHVKHETVRGANLGLRVQACVRNRQQDPDLVAVTERNWRRVDVAWVNLPDQDLRAIALVKHYRHWFDLTGDRDPIQKKRLGDSFTLSRLGSHPQNLPTGFQGELTLPRSYLWGNSSTVRFVRLMRHLHVLIFSLLAGHTDQDSPPAGDDAHQAISEQDTLRHHLCAASNTRAAPRPSIEI